MTAHSNTMLVDTPLTNVAPAQREAAQCVYAVDSYVDGIDMRACQPAPGSDLRESCLLALHHTASIAHNPGQSRAIHARCENSEKQLCVLEQQLQKISQRGDLSSTHIVLGHRTDPFSTFERSFARSRSLLRLFLRYRPGHLSIQTRSSLVLLVLPLLKELSEFSSITIAIETPNDEMALRLTPELSKPSERFSAATALRRFGLEVNFQVAPLLPYARRIEDVEFFAEKLVNHGDCTYVRSLADLLQCRLRGSNSRDPEAMRLRALSRNCGIEWLRKDSANFLLDALSELGSSSLGDKYKSRINDKQLSILYTPRQ